MKWKRIISFTLALSLVIGTVSGLPPLNITKKAEAKGSYWNKAYCWDKKDKFVDMINSKYKKTYGTTFHKDGGHVFKGDNGYEVDLSEKIKFPDGTGEETYRYWWFVTLDKYANYHSSSVGTTHKVISEPKNKVSQNTVWSTTYLRAKPEKSETWASSSAKGGYKFEYIELGGGKGKFKEDLGKTVNGMGVSMYVIDLKQWMADTKSNGYTKWKNKFISDDDHTIVRMYLNGVVKTSESGKGENSYRHKNIQTFSDWWKYTDGFGFHTESRKGEYYQHYNIPVEFDFGKIEDYKTNVVVESRLSQYSNKYAKTYTNQDFAWSKNINNIQRKNYESVYSELKTAEGKKNKDVNDGQFPANSGFKIDKSLIKALSKNGDLILRGVRLERYAVDRTKSTTNSAKQNIIPKSFTKKQTEKLKDKYFDYGDVAHVYLTGSVEELRKMYANPDSVTTTNHSVGDRNLAKASPAKNTFATKVKKVNVSDKGKFYTLNGKYNAKKTDKDSYTFTTKGNGSKDAKKKYDWASKDLGKAITYNQFLDYVCNLKFQVNPYEEYTKNDDRTKYENHLVFIFERAAEPTLTLDVERVSFNSKTGKYTSDGVEKFDVDTIYCGKDQDPVKEPVTLNVGATAKEVLTGNLPKNEATGDASDAVQKLLKGRSEELFYYKDSDPVPYILGGYVVKYANENNTETSKSISAGGEDKVKYEGTDYPIWDGSNDKIGSLLDNANSKLLDAKSQDYKARLEKVDLRQKCTIRCIYVKPKTLATQINYIKDKDKGSKDVYKAIITQNEKDVYSKGIKDNKGNRSTKSVAKGADLSSDSAGYGTKHDKNNVAAYNNEEFTAIEYNTNSVRIAAYAQATDVGGWADYTKSEGDGGMTSEGFYGKFDDEGKSYYTTTHANIEEEEVQICADNDLKLLKTYGGNIGHCFVKVLPDGSVANGPGKALEAGESNTNKVTGKLLSSGSGDSIYSALTERPKVDHVDNTIAKRKQEHDDILKQLQKEQETLQIELQPEIDEMKKKKKELGDKVNECSKKITQCHNNENQKNYWIGLRNKYLSEMNTVVNECNNAQAKLDEAAKKIEEENTRYKQQEKDIEAEKKQMRDAEKEQDDAKAGKWRWYYITYYTVSTSIAISKQFEYVGKGDNETWNNFYFEVKHDTGSLEDRTDLYNGSNPIDQMIDKDLGGELFDVIKDFVFRDDPAAYYYFKEPKLSVEFSAKHVIYSQSYVADGQFEGYFGNADDAVFDWFPKGNGKSTPPEDSKRTLKKDCDGIGSIKFNNANSTGSVLVNYYDIVDDAYGHLTVNVHVGAGSYKNKEVNTNKSIADKVEWTNYAVVDEDINVSGNAPVFYDALVKTSLKQMVGEGALKSNEKQYYTPDNYAFLMNRAKVSIYDKESNLLYSKEGSGYSSGDDVEAFNAHAVSGPLAFNSTLGRQNEVYSTTNGDVNTKVTAFGVQYPLYKCGLSYRNNSGAKYFAMSTTKQLLNSLQSTRTMDTLTSVDVNGIKDGSTLVPVSVKQLVVNKLPSANSDVMYNTGNFAVAKLNNLGYDAFHDKNGEFVNHEGAGHENCRKGDYSNCPYSFLECFTSRFRWNSLNWTKKNEPLDEWDDGKGAWYSNCQWMEHDGKNYVTDTNQQIKRSSKGDRRLHPADASGSAAYLNQVGEKIEFTQYKKYCTDRIVLDVYYYYEIPDSLTVTGVTPSLATPSPTEPSNPYTKYEIKDEEEDLSWSDFDPKQTDANGNVIINSSDLGITSSVIANSKSGPHIRYLYDSDNEDYQNGAKEIEAKGEIEITNGGDIVLPNGRMIDGKFLANKLGIKLNLAEYLTRGTVVKHTVTVKYVTTAWKLVQWQSNGLDASLNDGGLSKKYPKGTLLSYDMQTAKRVEYVQAVYYTLKELCVYCPSSAKFYNYACNEGGDGGDLRSPREQEGQENYYEDLGQQNKDNFGTITESFNGKSAENTNGLYERDKGALKSDSWKEHCKFYGINSLTGGGNKELGIEPDWNYHVPGLGDENTRKLNKIYAGTSMKEIAVNGDSVVYELDTPALEGALQAAFGSLKYSDSESSEESDFEVKNGSADFVTPTGIRKSIFDGNFCAIRVPENSYITALNTLEVQQAWDDAVTYSGDSFKERIESGLTELNKEFSIDKSKLNSTESTYSDVNSADRLPRNVSYVRVNYKGGDGVTIKSDSTDAPTITLFTPVAVSLSMSSADGIANSQKIADSDSGSAADITLGDSVKLTLGSAKSSDDMRYYGSIDTEAYYDDTDEIEISATCDTYVRKSDGTTKYYKAGDTILTNRKQLSEDNYYIPNWVKCKVQDFEVKVLALNARGKVYDRSAAVTVNENGEQMYFGAYAACFANVSGKIGNLKIFDISDYPTLKDVFGTVDNVLTDGLHSALARSSSFTTDGIGIYPLVDTEKLSSTSYGTTKFGYKFRYKLTTVGKEGRGSFVKIRPTFRWVSSDGKTERSDIKIYYRENVNGVSKNLIEVGSEEDKSNKHTLSLASKEARVSDSLLERTARLNGYLTPEDITKYKSKVSANWTYGDILLDAQNRVFTGEKNSPNFLYSNDGKVQFYVGELSTELRNSYFWDKEQTWIGEYYLPAETHVRVSNPKTDAQYLADSKMGIDFNEDYWLKDGYLVVNFEIVALDGGNTDVSIRNADGSLNKDLDDDAIAYDAHRYNSGKFNAWAYETDGASGESGHKTKTDENGNVFKFKDGDVMMYNLGSANDDFSNVGTH